MYNRILVFDMLFDNYTSYGVIANSLLSALVGQNREDLKLILAPWPGSNWFASELRRLPKLNRGRNSLDTLPLGSRMIRLSGSDSSGLAYYNFLADTPPVEESLAKLRQAPYVIVPAQGTADFFKSEYEIFQNVRVVHRGCDFEYWEWKADHQSPFIFLYVGYLIEAKGVDLIIKAFEAAFPEDPNVRLILKGNAPESQGMPAKAQAIKDLLAKFEQDRRIKVIEQNWEYETMESLYWAADCFVYPFKVVGFSGGKACLEARKTGCQIIAPKIGDVMLWADARYLLDAETIKAKPSVFQSPEQWTFDAQWGTNQYSLRLDFNQLVNVMKQVYEERIYPKPLDGWTWEDAAREFLKVLDEG